MRLFRKAPKGDIELPAESPRDPRLPRHVSVGDQFRKAGEGYKTLREKGLLGGKKPNGDRSMSGKR